MKTVRSSVLCRLLPFPISLVLRSLVLVLLFTIRKLARTLSHNKEIHTNSADVIMKY